MPRYAIDVVILPPEPTTDLAIEWNRKLSHLSHQSILLNKSDMLPHISLLMGCMEESNLHEATTVLHQLTEVAVPISLEVKGLKFTEDSHPVAALDIQTTPSLLATQKWLIGMIEGLITQDTVEADLFDAPSGSTSALKWINSFIPEQTGSKFWPHITLGHGVIGEHQRSFSFTPDRLAICHLGKYCTCRQVLSEVSWK
ncbi:MAG: 2'-5' RNA ligase family protein [Chryseolinea sp.]